jgi:hypothetical protein
MRWTLAAILILGIGTAIVAGAWHISVAGYTPDDGKRDAGAAFVSGELLKGAFSFVIIVIGGTVIKLVVDTSLERQRERRADAHQDHERRRAVVDELVAVYSGFYAARKLYHSAISSHNSLYSADDEAIANLRRALLERIVELDGRYGAVKMLALTTFGLRTDFLGVKEAKQLRVEVAQEQDPKFKIRLMLDLLGEAYDDWRHALEDKRKIAMAVDVWETYEPLLQFFLMAPLDARLRAA